VPKCSRLQLQSLNLGSDGCAATAALLQHLPAHSLTHLDCRLSSGSLPDSAAKLQLVCQLTALCSLILEGSSALAPPGDAGNVLVCLSALQQLTQLQLPSVHRTQLAQLQLPQLQQLQVC
jgi:hypothetical protein